MQKVARKQKTNYIRINNNALINNKKSKSC